MPTPRLLIVAQQAAASIQVAREFSQSTAAHAMESATHDPLEVMLVALGVLVVIVTTVYSLLYLIHPGETSADHIKRRILQDGREGVR